MNDKNYKMIKIIKTEAEMCRSVTSDVMTSLVSNGWTTTTVREWQTFSNFHRDKRKLEIAIAFCFLIALFPCRVIYCIYKCGISDGSEIWHTAEGRQWRRGLRELFTGSGSSVAPQEDASQARWF